MENASGAAGLEPLVTAAHREVMAIALASIERLGRDSPAALLCCDKYLLRYFAECALHSHTCSLPPSLQSIHPASLPPSPRAIAESL